MDRGREGKERRKLGRSQREKSLPGAAYSHRQVRAARRRVG